MNIECYEQVKFYEYLLFDTVILHRVNYMPVFIYKDKYHYYQYENSILITKNKLKNDKYVPGILNLKHYINHINSLILKNYFIIHIDGYHNPLSHMINFIDISVRYKIQKIQQNIKQ